MHDVPPPFLSLPTSWYSYVIHALLLLVFLHLFCRLAWRKTRPLPSLSDEDTYVPVIQPQPLPSLSLLGPFPSPGAVGEARPNVVPGQSVRTELVVAVTGGAGFLGSAIVRHLLARGHSVVVLDLAPASASSAASWTRGGLPSETAVPDVSYHRVDLCRDLDETDSIQCRSLAHLLRRLSVQVVVHTAGCVCLADDHGLLFNAHVVATRRIIRASRMAGVRALVHTSSTGAITTPYVDKLSHSQRNIPNSFDPCGTFHFPSHYAKTKYEAERIARRATSITNASSPSTPSSSSSSSASSASSLASSSSSPASTELRALPQYEFVTCALRLPGVYGCYEDGRGDNLMVEGVLSGTVTHVPLGAQEMDFAYVENAAHGHVCAVEALLNFPEQVAGKTFNISNEERFLAGVTTWNQMLAIVHEPVKTAAESVVPRTFPPLRKLSHTLGLFAAFLSETLFALLNGRVPLRRHAFWNLTRVSLGLAGTSVTLEACDPVLKYKPIFTNEASFRDIKSRWRSASQRARAHPAA